MHRQGWAMKGIGGHTIVAPVARAGIATIAVDASGMGRTGSRASRALVDINVATGTLEPGQSNKEILLNRQPHLV